MITVKDYTLHTNYTFDENYFRYVTLTGNGVISISPYNNKMYRVEFLNDVNWINGAKA